MFRWRGSSDFPGTALRVVDSAAKEESSVDARVRVYCQTDLQ